MYEASFTTEPLYKGVVAIIGREEGVTGYQFCGVWWFLCFVIIRFFVFPFILCSWENEKGEQSKEYVIKLRIGQGFQ